MNIKAEHLPRPQFNQQQEHYCSSDCKQTLPYRGIHDCRGCMSTSLHDFSVPHTCKKYNDGKELLGKDNHD